jgi:flagellar biosynthesis/type III secretory pathway M-ring protein FliF/YscJ
MKKMTALLFVFALFVAILVPLAGCQKAQEEEGLGQAAEEAMGQIQEEAQEAAAEIGDAVEGAVEEGSEAVDEAVEAVEEAVPE